MRTSEVKLSFFTMPVHPTSRNYVETLKEDREAILLADALGFAEAFVGEHVTDIAESVTSSLMLCASLADATKQIRLGSGTVNMPNNHPAQVAAQVAMIDTMLEGRFLFGISPADYVQMPKCSVTSIETAMPCLSKRSIRRCKFGQAIHRMTLKVNFGRSQPRVRWISRSGRARSCNRTKSRIRRS